MVKYWAEHQDLMDWDQVRQLQDDVGASYSLEILQMFLHETELAMGEFLDVNPALTSRERQDLLHFLKGSCLSLGFLALARLCLAAEEKLSGRGEEFLDVTQIEACFEASKHRLYEDPNSPFRATQLKTQPHGQ